jgi:hypothetical protein
MSDRIAALVRFGGGRDPGPMMAERSADPSDETVRITPILPGPLQPPPAEAQPWGAPVAAPAPEAAKPWWRRG